MTSFLGVVWLPPCPAWPQGFLLAEESEAQLDVSEMLWSLSSRHLSEGEKASQTCLQSPADPAPVWEMDPQRNNELFNCHSSGMDG